MILSKFRSPLNSFLRCEGLFISKTKVNQVKISRLYSKGKEKGYLSQSFQTSQGYWSEANNKFQTFKSTIFVTGAVLSALLAAHLIKNEGMYVYLLPKATQEESDLANPLSHSKKESPSQEDKSHEEFLKEHKKKNLPSKVPYLIIGAGTSAHAAFRSIKIHDPQARILLVGEENYPPYMRPPLSKEIWYNDERLPAKSLMFKQWNGKYRSIFYEHNEYYCPVEELYAKEHGGVAIAGGLRVVSIDPKKQVAYFENGGQIEYEKCLIATGGKPRNLEIIEKAPEKVKERVTLFRNIEDFIKVAEISSEKNKIAVIGGGFLGSELSCALSRKGAPVGVEVVQVMIEPGCVGRVLPEYLSQWTTEKVKQEGVHVVNNTHVNGIALVDDKVELSLSSQEEPLQVDHVIVAVGLEPDIQLATASGLEVDPDLGGFKVDSQLQAANNLWVAGDAASFNDPQLGRRRVEHHDHAVVSGKLAGENMTGAGKSYHHQSMFWSDLGPEVGFEAIGLVDSSLPTVAVFAKSSAKDSPKPVVESTNESTPSGTEQSANAMELVQMESVVERTKVMEDFGKGIIFYMKGKVIVGILLWNVFNKMSIARKILKQGQEYEDLTEVAKLFKMYDSEVE